MSSMQLVLAESAFEARVPCPNFPRRSSHKQYGKDIDWTVSDIIDLELNLLLVVQLSPS